MSVNDHVSTKTPSQGVQMYEMQDGNIDQDRNEENEDGYEDGQRMSNVAAEGDTFATLDDDTRTDDTHKFSLN